MPRRTAYPHTKIDMLGALPITGLSSSFALIADKAGVPTGARPEPT
jgi:hypothetical protein